MKDDATQFAYNNSDAAINQSHTKLEKALEQRFGEHQMSHKAKLESLRSPSSVPTTPWPNIRPTLAFICVKHFPNLMMTVATGWKWNIL